MLHILLGRKAYLAHCAAVKACHAWLEDDLYAVIVETLGHLDYLAFRRAEFKIQEVLSG